MHRGATSRSQNRPRIGRGDRDVARGLGARIQKAIAPPASIVNRKSSIENYLRACLTVMDRNPQAVEKALMNKP
jgi:hypothetical protein